MELPLHRQVRALSRDLFDSSRFSEMKLEAGAEDEAARENSAHSNNTNFLSKFKDSYAVNQSLNSLTKQEEGARGAQFQPPKSTRSKTSLKKDQSKDGTTANAPSLNVKQPNPDFHQSMGKLSEPTGQGSEPPLGSLRRARRAAQREEGGRAPLNMSLNHHFKPRVERHNKSVDVRQPRPAKPAPNALRSLGLNNVTTNSSFSNSMIISDSSKNPFPSGSRSRKWAFDSKKGFYSSELQNSGMNGSSAKLRHSRISRHTNPSEMTFQVSAKSRKNMSEGFLRESNSFTECRHFPRRLSCLGSKKDAPKAPRLGALNQSTMVGSGNWDLERFNNSGFRRASPRPPEDSLERFSQREELCRTKRAAERLNRSFVPKPPGCAPTNQIFFFNNSQVKNLNFNSKSMAVIDENPFESLGGAPDAFNSSIQQQLRLKERGVPPAPAFVSEQQPGFSFFHNSLAQRDAPEPFLQKRDGFEETQGQFALGGWEADSRSNATHLERKPAEPGLSIRPINYNILDRQFPFSQSNNQLGAALEAQPVGSEQVEKSDLQRDSLENSLPSSKRSLFMKLDQGFNFFSARARDAGPGNPQEETSGQGSFLRFESSLTSRAPLQSNALNSLFNPSRN